MSLSRLTQISNAANGRACFSCECGKTIECSVADVKRGNTKSCGCLRADIQRARCLSNNPSRKTHGMKSTRTYECWSSMKKRCKYHDNYKGRGISVCARWEVFENFLADMGEVPEGMSIDRINNDIGYDPANCRWADSLTQTRNRRNTIKAEYYGDLLFIAEIAEKEGVSYSAIKKRMALHGKAYFSRLTHSA